MKVFRILTQLFPVLLFHVSAPAQQPQWEAMPDFSAGISRDMVETPTGALLLAGPVSLVGENGRGLFRLEEDATVLQDVSPTWSRISALESTGDGSLLCASEEALWRSVDDGLTWKKTQDSLYGAFSDLRTLQDGHCYAITKEGTFFRSTDDGGTWDTLSTALRARARYGMGHTDFIGMNHLGWFIVATPLLRAHFSTDGGSNWMDHLRIEDSIVVYPRVVDEQFISLYDGGIVSAHMAGVERQSPDWRSYKETFLMPRGPERIAVTDLIGNGGRTLYLGVGTEDYFGSAPDIPQDSTGILVSWDDGHSWSWLLTGLDVQALLLKRDGELIASTLFEGFFRIDTTTGHHVPMPFCYGHVSDILCADNVVMATLDSCHVRGVLRSEDGGTTWNWNDNLRQWFSDPAPRLWQQSGGMILRGGTRGMHVSSDAGRSWSKVQASIYKGWHYLLSMTRCSDASWLAADFISPHESRTDCIIYYLDSGWTEVAHYPARDMGQVYDLHATASGSVIAASDAGVFLSTNKGQSWSQRSSDVSTHLFTQRDSTVYAASSGYVLASMDHGVTWLYQATQPGYMVHALAARQGTVFCSSARAYDDRGTPLPGYGSGIILSVHGGAWNETKQGLPTDEITALAVDEKGVLYAGTRGCGMFRSTAPVLNVERVEARAIRPFRATVYPQPVRQNALLQLRLEIDASVTITLRDMLGRRVGAARTRQFSTGIHALPLTDALLSPGIYLVEISSADAAEYLQISVMR